MKGAVLALALLGISVRNTKVIMIVVSQCGHIETEQLERSFINSIISLREKLSLP